jgi:hypothetical protein
MSAAPPPLRFPSAATLTPTPPPVGRRRFAPAAPRHPPAEPPAHRGSGRANISDATGAALLSAGVSSTARDRRGASKKFVGVPPGGADHLSSAMAVAAGPADASAASPRRVRGVGGEDHVVLGSEAVSYECGVKEAQFRLATDAAMRAAAAAEAVAGVRPQPHGRRVPAFPVGGPVRVVLSDGSGDGPQAYNAGLDEVQRRAALDPAARAEVDAQPVAGARISREPGMRVTRPAGGFETVGLMKWDTGADTPARRGSSAGAPPAAPSPRAVAAVGGRSAPFIGARSSMGAILRGDPADASAARPDTAGSRRGTANVSSGVAEFFARDGSGGAGGAAGAGGPRSPSNPLKREQPIGGRSMLAIGLSGIDASTRPEVTGVKTLAHHRSNVTFG